MLPNLPIYLDHAASTAIDPRVRAAVIAAMDAGPANPASRHQAGRNAAATVRKAREQVAALVGATANDVIFTSGATEAINLAIRGLCLGRTRRLATLPTEHKATLETAAAVSKLGTQVSMLRLNEFGLLEPRTLFDARLAGGDLVAVMHTNNETGIVQPLDFVGDATRRASALLLCDATQAVGWTELDMHECGIDLLVLSGHKIGAPLGIGALVATARARRALAPVITGGGQEQSLRGGTVNVPAIVGLGVACELLVAERANRRRQMLAVRSVLERMLLDQIPDARVVGSQIERAPHCTNLVVRGVDGDALVASLAKSVQLSNGSACNGLEPRPSHVLVAMGLSSQDAASAVRLSIAHDTTTTDVATAAQRVAERVRELRTP